jgi:hypothetical protein
MGNALAASADLSIFRLVNPALNLAAKRGTATSSPRRCRGLALIFPVDYSIDHSLIILFAEHLTRPDYTTDYGDTQPNEADFGAIRRVVTMLSSQYAF